MKIHPEGRSILFFTLVTLVIGYAIIYYILPEWEWLHNLILVASVLLYVFVLQFFRHPDRAIERNTHHILAPADGKVVAIEEVTETEYFQEPKIQVSIFMSIFNVHVNRNPVEGNIVYFKYHEGKYLAAWHPKSSTENERTTIVYRTNQYQQVLIRQIAGALARRIRWYIRQGDEVEQGEAFGFIKFGSRVDLFLPLNTKILVNLNEKVRGGQTIIGEFS